jgi:Tfp pilus assembly protein PilO
MALARALVTLYHQNTMRVPGEEFEYEGKLDNPATDGMEWVNKKTTAAAKKAAADKLAALQDEAAQIKTALDALRVELEQDPSRSDLVAQVLETESKLQDAEKAVVDATPADDADLV